MSKPAFSDLWALSGRRNRKSWTLLWLACFGFYIAVLATVVTLSTNFGGGVFLFYILASVLLGYALTVGLALAQRCRDFGWSGWAALLVFIPLLGAIFFFALFFIPGTHGPNKYGPDPLEPATPTAD